MAKVRKAIMAAALAAAAALGPALPGGLNAVEVGGVLAAALVAYFSVYKVRNAK